MALSEQEQRLLEEMERSLYQNDADVVSTTPKGGPVVSAKAVTIIVLSVVVGLGIVIGGMASTYWWIGLIGFVVMIAGIFWALRGSNSSGKGMTSGSSAAGPSASKGSSAKPRKTGGSFMDRVEDRWERRQDGEL
ncbi:DUF3040 domain-containing protein [Gulosibacter molinativorax]|uniref:DUF3040 domain-containing protein n=1 Tax=Gulosibacter molinativorax TaxID=256821 RepID=A0ABT7C5B1_9MICO|nr:DUF3040 domain-containing protein [Gulosibacter molinativorax]MDJ1370388.1 DUF3040 domain-containing protein [Gulosibacter molinativorax]QUY61301.1 Membrane protein [Gulosibacter molinativorax]